MSVVLTYTPPAFDLAQLHDELLRAGIVPELVRAADVAAPDPDPPPPPALPTPTRVPTVFLTFPDGTDGGEVDAVVAAHVPQARYEPAALLAHRAPLLAANRRRADLTRLRRAVAAAQTVDALRAATAGVLDFLEKEQTA